jgi:hypothetical protein
MIVDSEDYLQDVAFDYYGSKMAVCSSDRKIKIFDKTDDGSWEQVACLDVIILLKLFRHMMLLSGKYNGLIQSLV